jgi:Flp pilus assembly protein TadB
MNNDIKNILTNSNKDIDNQELLQYLSQQLNAEREHQLEQDMAADEFLNDAVEGLQQVESTRQINLHVQELQTALARQLEKKKKPKQRRFTDNPQQYLYIVIVLLLIIICFLVYRKLVQLNPSSTSKTAMVKKYQPVKQNL